MIPHYPQGEGKYLGLFCHFSPSNLCFPSQTFPYSPPGLLTASGMLVHLSTFPFPTPTSGRPIYFILIYFYFYLFIFFFLNFILFLNFT